METWASCYKNVDGQTKTQSPEKGSWMGPTVSTLLGWLAILPGVKEFPVSGERERDPEAHQFHPYLEKAFPVVRPREVHTTSVRRERVPEAALTATPKPVWDVTS